VKILSWNVNGIRACRKKGFLDFLEQSSPDILCLQETKAHPEQLDDALLSPPGYNTVWNNPDRKGYAGVSIFSKIAPKTIQKDFSDNDFDAEGRALISDYGKFILVNVYFPNGGMGEHRLKYKLDFYERFLQYLDGLKNRNIIFCGDINTAHKEIDLARPKPNMHNTGFLPEERAWIDKVIDHGYVDVYRKFDESPDKYTWWDYKSRARERNVGWRIDYFFATREFVLQIKGAFILPEVHGSDHCPIGIEIEA
jgi:exodeoxyribonuclease III